MKMRNLFASIALAAMATASHASIAQAQSTDAQTEMMVAAANAFIATLTQEQQSAVQ